MYTHFISLTIEFDLDFYMWHWCMYFTCPRLPHPISIFLSWVIKWLRLCVAGRSCTSSRKIFATGMPSKLKEPNVWMSLTLKSRDIWTFIAIRGDLFKLNFGGHNATLLKSSVCENVGALTILNGLHVPRIEFRWWRGVSHPFRPSLGPIHLPVQWVLGLFPRSKAAGAWP